MQKPIRRSDRALSQEQAMEILFNGEYGILSTVSSDGQPYGIPVSFSFNSNAIFFHSAVKGHKLENLAANSRVSFCVVGKTEILPGEFGTRYESAIVFGKAIELTDTEKLVGLNEIVKKYSPDFLEEGQVYIENNAKKARVYKIEIEAISGKAKR
jgi:nitroimidazol reductase NimA-like FMN-containing flavoprotein (pyridoxamine 5'-phosphate oxidase superfamily)